MGAICGASDPGVDADCDFCNEQVCDDCIVEAEGISNNVFCSEDCLRDFVEG